MKHCSHCSNSNPQHFFGHSFGTWLTSRGLASLNVSSVSEQERVSGRCMCHGSPSTRARAALDTCHSVRSETRSKVITDWRGATKQQRLDFISARMFLKWHHLFQQFQIKHWWSERKAIDCSTGNTWTVCLLITIKMVLSKPHLQPSPANQKLWPGACSQLLFPCISHNIEGWAG